MCVCVCVCVWVNIYVYIYIYIIRGIFINKGYFFKKEKQNRFFFIDGISSLIEIAL